MKQRKFNHPLARTPVTDCGKCVCEEDDFGEWLVMLPNGRVVHVKEKRAAEEKCAAWFKKHCASNEISYGKIEWHFQPKPALTTTSEVLQPT